jgi:hypothetical protein
MDAQFVDIITIGIKLETKFQIGSSVIPQAGLGKYFG